MKIIGLSASFYRIGLLAVMILFGLAPSGNAQRIVPDSTLGEERSTVRSTIRSDNGSGNGSGNGLGNSTSVQLIEGGASRGSNLFHSFRLFDVGGGESVYFANPVNVENIFSRVTGGSISRIDGLLGVDGGANLFFLNPNGIVFGPDAQLDIAGSFTASTASGFGFADGGVFEAIAPETSLLSISVPLGIQLNNTQPIGDLSNAAFLAVGPGAKLDLIGNQVSTTVQLSASGGVRVLGNKIELLDRENPFSSNVTDETEIVFQAANGIAIPDVADNELKFLDGLGNIQLVADADMDGRGNLVMADVQDSLHASGRNLAGSGVNIILGDVNTSTFEGRRDGGDIAISSISGDIRVQNLDSSSSVYSRSYSPSIAEDSGNGGDITISSTSGSIRTQTLNASSASSSASASLSAAGNSGNGGNITISSMSGDIRTEDLNTYSASTSTYSRSYSFSGDSGNGGNVSISSTSGDISTQNLNTYSRTYAYSTAYSFSGDSGNGGDVSISSMSGDIDTQELNTSSRSYSLSDVIGSSNSFAYSGESGDGGNVSISSMSGDIATQDINTYSRSRSRSLTLGSASSRASSVNSGNGGDVTIDAMLGAISTQAINTYSTSRALPRTFTGIVDFVGDSGRGGNITISSTVGSISTQNLDTSSSSHSNAIATLGNSGNGGNILISSTSGDIDTQAITSRSGSRALSRSSGNAGSVEISSESGAINVQSVESYSMALSGGVNSPGDSGNGGNITISSVSGDIDVVFLSAYSRSRAYSPSALEDSKDQGAGGNGGNISVSSIDGSISIQGVDSDSNSSYGDSGNAGDVTISSQDRAIRVQGSISAVSSSSGDSGNGGRISITSQDGDISTQDISSTSTTFSGDSGNGGNITLSSTSGDISTRDLDSASVASSRSFARSVRANSADGGDISISSMSGDISTQDINSASAAILDSDSLTEPVPSGDSGNGGSISLVTNEGSILGSRTPLLFSGSFSQSGGDTGRGGSVILQSGQISDLSIITLASGGKSGDVDIQSLDNLSNRLTNSLTINDLSIITTAQVDIPDPQFPERTISLNLNNIGQSGNTFIRSLDDIDLNNFSIQGDANGRQAAGNITITSPGQVTFSNSEISTNANSSGAAGNILIEAARVSLGEGDRLLATTSATGTGGTITINATESVAIGENVKDFAPIISVEASDAGRPGNIEINTPRFDLFETARITATSTGNASNPDGGSIDLNANQMNLAGIVGIFAETQGSASGGTLTLRPYQANLIGSAGSQAQNSATSSDAASNPSGNSFNLTLAKDSLISASTSGSGSGGDLQLLAPESITISGPGRLAVETRGPGQAGNITATARTFTLTDRAVLSASTSGSGQAGNIAFTIADALTIDGNTTTVESLTTAGSEGPGGNINVRNAGATNLTNGGSFSLNSEGTGAGGDLDLTTGSLTLDNGNITATTLDSDGGNFTFTLSDYLLLRNGSLISTTAGTADAGGNGGRIAIDVPNGFIVALPNENSDIRANAFDGDGGNVNITARNLLGIAFRPGLSDTPASDITSSSRFGSGGAVTINEINPEAIQPEDDLPVETAPATVARGCRAQGSQTGSFVSTGRGGLPTGPVDVLSANTLWQDLEPLESTLGNALASASTTSLAPSSPLGAETEKTIAEAQGWSRSADGTVTLIAESVEPPSYLESHLATANSCAG